jgi:leucyl-tRNA synthetase
LPAENYAIKEGVAPDITTAKNINRFREQIKSIGLSYDWNREISTADPDYYKWTQWLFLLLYKNGLAYKKEARVNWCPSDNTVLANEQVVNGKCERCGAQVIQKMLSQWFFKITAYAERLLNELDHLDWPVSIKAMQQNWIGRKEGINIDYRIEGTAEKVTCFTTRPDTNFGATFVVIGPEHPLIADNNPLNIPADKWQAIQEYKEKVATETELERTATNRQKTGVFTGLYCINNLNDYRMPLYVADYVLGNVGTGAVVGVPGHDVRDFEFAQAFDIPVIRVVMKDGTDTEPITRLEQVQEDEGVMMNSGFLDGLDIHEATRRVMDYLEEHKFGTRIINYKLRDWLISRQRYWGAPIPIVYCDNCGMQPVPEDQLPVLLPNDVDFLPTGESPLARSESFHQAKCPNCAGPARRDSDTMDTFVDSSWYFFRYTDPNNAAEFADKGKIKTWLPVDTYVGGAEHAVLHLLYSRFFTKVTRF